MSGERLLDVWLKRTSEIVVFGPFFVFLVHTENAGLRLSVKYS